MGGGSDGEEDEDDLPLTCLLTRIKRKGPPRRSKSSKQSIQKKLRKLLSSKSTAIDRVEKEKNRPSAERTEEKPRNVVGKLVTASDSKELCTSKATDKLIKNESKILSSLIKNPSLNQLELFRNGSYGTETIVHSCEERVLLPKASRRIALEPNGSARPMHRLHSDSAMESVTRRQSSDDSYAPKIHNIIHKLNRRITNGGCLSHHPYNPYYSSINKAGVIQNKRFTISSSYSWSKKWRIPSWLSLEQPAMGNISHMAWDKMGVLLAVVVDRAIIIYDWDILRAADLHGRSDRARNCRESKFMIPPIVKFRLKHPVESIVWNPFEMDELAVGFR